MLRLCCGWGVAAVWVTAAKMTRIQNRCEFFQVIRSPLREATRGVRAYLEIVINDFMYPAMDFYLLEIWWLRLRWGFPYL